jgi:cell division transport system permease protein
MNVAKKISFSDKIHSLLIQHRQACVSSFMQLWQTPVASFITLGVIAVVMALPLGLYAVSKNINTVTEQWNKGGELTLFLQDNLSKEQVATLKKNIASQSGVAKVTYRSPEHALNEFQTMAQMGDVMVALDSNPLPGLMIVEPAFTDVNQLQNLKTELSTLPEVSMAQLDIAWVQRLNALLGMLNQLVFTLAILLGVGLLFVVGNTTRTAIAQRQQEILVAKLVGANDAYVCRPFLYTGFWYGLLGATLSLLVLGLVGVSLAPALDTLLQSYQSQWRPEFIGLRAMLGTLGFAILISMLGAWLAVWRYLFQIQPR